MDNDLTVALFRSDKFHDHVFFIEDRRVTVLMCDITVRFIECLCPAVRVDDIHRLEVCDIAGQCNVCLRHHLFDLKVECRDSILNGLRV